jgi:hypothetical protein
MILKTFNDKSQFLKIPGLTEKDVEELKKAYDAAPPMLKETINQRYSELMDKMLVHS